MKITAIIFIVIIVLSRLILGGNFELVTPIAITSGFLFKGYSKFMVPLAAIFISDLLIGNTAIFIFTWTGFLAAPLFGTFLSKNNNNRLQLGILSLGAGIGSVLFFFLWTNLGVVLTTNLYPVNLTGLILSYESALPFLKPQLASALIFTPILVVMGDYLKQKHFLFKPLLDQELR